MPLNQRDTLTPYQLPPESRLWPEIQPLVAEYRKLLGDRRASQQQLGRLEDDYLRAVESDKVALAQALRDGKPDPGSKAVEKLDKERANTRRTIESLEIAILDVEAELDQAIEEQKAGQAERVEDEISEACEEYAAAIDALETARQTLVESVAMRRFLESFPERSWRPGGWKLWKLLATHGDPYDFGKVAEALRYDIEIVQQPRAEAQAESSGPLNEQLHEVAAGGWQPTGVPNWEKDR